MLRTVTTVHGQGHVFNMRDKLAIPLSTYTQCLDDGKAQSLLDCPAIFSRSPSAKVFPRAQSHKNENPRRTCCGPVSEEYMAPGQSLFYRHPRTCRPRNPVALAILLVDTDVSGPEVSKPRAPLAEGISVSFRKVCRRYTQMSGRPNTTVTGSIRFFFTMLRR